MGKMLELRHLMAVFFVSIVFLLPLNALAEETHSASSPALWVTRTVANVKLTAKVEDAFVIDGQHYLFSGKTKFVKYEQKKEKPFSVTQMEFPCQAQITYKVLTATDEAHPYMKGQRVLIKVIVQ